MPMVPGPLAALTYGAVKVLGYAYFARQLNQRLGVTVSPYKFGFAKTAIGLAGGMAYVFLLLHTMAGEDVSDLKVFIGAAPVRMLAWSLALALFYRFRGQAGLFGVAVLVGTAWSYVLDGVMWALYKVLPGMVMPWC